MEIKFNPQVREPVIHEGRLRLLSWRAHLGKCVLNEKGDDIVLIFDDSELKPVNGYKYLNGYEATTNICYKTGKPCTTKCYVYCGDTEI